MKDISEIMNKVNGELSEKTSFGGRIYKDEPIVRPASGLSSYTPERITEISKLLKTREYLFMSGGELIRRIGKMMEDFTDNYDKTAPFSCYYPTYADMDKPQLRTYFTWRTKVREGNVTDIPLSYAFLYAYELIALIGVKDAEEGFVRLKRFMLDFSVYEPKITKYFSEWLVEFAAYYDLPKEYLRGVYLPDMDNAAYTLIHCGEYSDGELFPAVMTVSSYNFEASAFFREYPEDCQNAVCRVYRAWAEYCGKRRTKDLAERLFGIRLRKDHRFFDNAVFCEEDISPDRVYTVSPLYSFECKDGKWQTDRYPAGIKKSTELGAVIREIDRVMRKCFGFPKELKPSFDNKSVSKIIGSEIKKLTDEKKEREKRNIVIDLSSLDKIRLDAEITRERLLTEEESEDNLSAENVPAEEKENGNSPLDDIQREFLSVLISGGDVNTFSRERGVMLSMLCDGINEKLFDMFGDSVIFFDGDIPDIYEDYLDDIKELL